MSGPLVYVYLLAPEHLHSLRQINTALFGDGAALTPDRRRDLANRMHLIMLDVAKYGVGKEEFESWSQASDADNSGQVGDGS